MQAQLHTLINCLWFDMNSFCYMHAEVHGFQATHRATQSSCKHTSETAANSEKKSAKLAYICKALDDCYSYNLLSSCLNSATALRNLFLS